MESISQLVSDSLTRNGIEPSLDHLRLEWSRWFRCDSSFSVLLVPAKPGLFALGEEVLAPEDGAGKRMLAVFDISETDDLGMTLGRLFLPGNPLGEKLAAGRCFARFTVIEEVAQRAAACTVFQRWMQESAETATGMEVSKEPGGAEAPARAEDIRSDGAGLQPSLAFAWGMETPTGNADGAVRGRAPLPSGF